MSLFTKMRMAWQLRLLSAASIFIFLSVISLNYVAIGDVQEINQTLRDGALADRESWVEIQGLIAEAEVVRLNFLNTRDSAMTAGMQDILDKTQAELGNLKSESANQALASLNEYGKVFSSLVSAEKKRGTVRQRLSETRTALETQVYGAGSPALEGALSELVVAELTYFASRTPATVNSVKVLLDRFLRDSADKAGGADIATTVRTYREVFDTVTDSNSIIGRLATAMVEAAKRIDKSGEQSLDDAAQAAQLSVAAEVSAVAATSTRTMIWTGLALLLMVVFSLFFERSFNLNSAVKPVARPTKVRKMCEKMEKLSRRRTHPYGER